MTLASAFQSSIINHQSKITSSLYLGVVLHESCRNSVRARGLKIAQLLVRQEIKNFWLGAHFTFSTVAQTVSGTEHWELLFNREIREPRERRAVEPQMNADEHGLLLRTRRWFPHTSAPRPQTCAQGRFRGVDATHGPAAGPASRPHRAARPHSGPSGLGAGNVACTCDVLRRRFMGRTPLEDGPSADSYGRSPIQGFAFLIPASSARARSLFIPGTCDLTH
jgi:hypothetical protein